MTVIIFVKNLIYGSVKTRLAETIGHEKAFQVYRQLITYTISIVNELVCKKMVYYSDYIEWNDEWMGTGKAVQFGQGLGERMEQAFKDSFDNESERSIIIGSDCFEITHEIIQDAFEKLNSFDVVIGPASDGGYYLLGMKKLHTGLFKNIAWSTSMVLETTVSICRTLNLSCLLLPVLNDVDEEKDLPQTKHQPEPPG